MKYIVLWALLNIHTGTIQGPYILTPRHEYTADQCAKALGEQPVQTPDKNGEIKVFECVAPTRASSMNYIRSSM